MDYRTTLTYETGTEPTDDHTAALAEALGGATIVTAEPTGRITIERTTTHPDMTAALALAVFDAGAALADAGLRTRDDRLTPASVTVAEADWHTAQIVEPGMPGTVQITDIAGILGVSHQRASQLAADDPNFPDPINPGGRTRLWDEDAIRVYARTRRRTSGRPRKHAPA